ncbi:MAG: type IV secretion system protein VirB10 [Sedimenticola sp.]
MGIDDDSENEESITQVGTKTKKKPIPVYFILFVLAALVIIAISMTIDSDNEDSNSGVSFTDEDYKVTNMPVPSMPKNETPAMPTVTKDESNHIYDIPKKRTAEENIQARKSRDLAERRRRSPLAMVNKRRSKSEDKITPRSEANKRREKLQLDTMNAVASLSQGNNEEGNESPASLRTPGVHNVQASYVFDRNFKLLQGKIIPAILETAINSDLAGMLRAIVSEEVYSENGNVLLIQKGSRLIGEYRSGIMRGQSRVFVIWSRLVTPKGIDIKMDSPGTDTLGRAGLTGYVDAHFLDRFGSSIMLSLISGFAQSNASNNEQRESIADSFNKSSEIAIENEINITQTVHVNQGERISVFVAKDLNFKQAIIFAQKAKRFEK